MVTGLKKNKFTQTLATGAAILGAIAGLGIAAESASANLPPNPGANNTFQLKDGGPGGAVAEFQVGPTNGPNGSLLDPVGLYYWQAGLSTDHFYKAIPTGGDPFGLDPSPATPPVPGQWEWINIGNGWQNVGANGWFDRANAIDRDGDRNDDTLIAFYNIKDTSGNILLEIEKTWLLTGNPVPAPGCCQSDIAEVVNIRNRSGSPIDFKFKEYWDVDNNDLPSPNMGEFVNRNRYTQMGNRFQFDVSQIARDDDGVVDPISQVALYDTSYPLITNDLVDDFGPKTGDVVAAWQWNFSLGATGAALISKDKMVGPKPVPEPTSILGLLAVGGLGLGLKRKKQG